MSEEQIARATHRARERLRAGESVGETLRVFREHDGLGGVSSAVALRAIAPIGLDTLKTLVEGERGGEDFSHLGLADLEQLAALPKGALSSHLRDAILYRRRWLLLTPGDRDYVRFYTAREPDTSRAGTGTGSLAQWRGEIRALAADENWRREIEIVRDEPEALLIRFVNVGSATLRQ